LVELADEGLVAQLASFAGIAHRLVGMHFGQEQQGVDLVLDALVDAIQAAQHITAALQSGGLGRNLAQRSVTTLLERGAIGKAREHERGSTGTGRHQQQRSSGRG
jgi:hypothetical protein